MDDEAPSLPPPKSKSETRMVIAIIVVAAVACTCFLSWPSPRPQTSESLSQSDLIITDIKAAPIEYQLAFLDSGHLPRGTDINAARIRYLLKELSEKTGDAPAQISDRTTRCTTVLKQDYGKAVTNQKFLEEANNYYKAGGPKMNYEALSTLLVMQMGK